EFQVRAVSVMLANVRALFTAFLPVSLSLAPQPSRSWQDGLIDTVFLAPRNLAAFPAAPWTAARRRSSGDDRLTHLQPRRASRTATSPTSPPPSGTPHATAPAATPASSPAAPARSPSAPSPPSPSRSTATPPAARPSTPAYSPAPSRSSSHATSKRPGRVDPIEPSCDL